MLTENEFFERVKALPNIILSVTGKASYTGFRIEGVTLYFHRVVPKTDWNLNLKELYNIYTNYSFINTSIIKTITGSRVNSPSFALLIAMKFYDKKGNRIL